MDRATDSGSVGRAFESRQAYSLKMFLKAHFLLKKQITFIVVLSFWLLSPNFFVLLEAKTLPAFPGQNSAGKFYRVLRVVDGDTLEIESIGEVRLIGVDTPELCHPLKPVQFYAREASEFVRNLVADSRVRIEYDREKIDKYGRTLVYVYLEDGRSLNEEIIKNGYGFAYTKFPFKYLLKYKQLEAQARAKGIGLWANQGLDEFRWVLAQKTVPYEIYELANNLWAIRYKNYVRLRLKAEELEKVLLNLRQWTNEFSDRDLEKILLENGWLKVK